VFSSYKKATLAIVDTVNNLVPGRQRYLRPETATISDALIASLADAGRVAYERQLLLSSVAEISVRRDERFVITGQGTDLLEIVPEDVRRTEIEAATLPGWAPVHFDWHRAIYKSTDSNAVLFCQPIEVVAAANMDNVAFAQASPVAASIVGGICVVPTSSDIPDTIKLYEHHAYVIPHAGAVVRGSSPRDAVRRAEALHYLARLVLAGS